MVAKFLKSGEDFSFPSDFGFSGSYKGRHDAKSKPVIDDDEFGDGSYVSRQKKACGGPLRKAEGGHLDSPEAYNAHRKIEGPMPRQGEGFSGGNELPHEGYKSDDGIYGKTYDDIMNLDKGSRQKPEERLGKAKGGNVTKPNPDQKRIHKSQPGKDKWAKPGTWEDHAEGSDENHMESPEAYHAYRGGRHHFDIGGNVATPSQMPPGVPQPPPAQGGQWTPPSGGWNPAGGGAPPQFTGQPPQMPQGGPPGAPPGGMPPGGPMGAPPPGMPGQPPQMLAHGGPIGRGHYAAGGPSLSQQEPQVPVPMSALMNGAKIASDLVSRGQAAGQRSQYGMNGLGNAARFGTQGPAGHAPIQGPPSAPPIAGLGAGHGPAQGQLGGGMPGSPPAHMAKGGHAKKWIQGMDMKKGALHRELHVPEGEKIPKGKLQKAAHSENPTLRRRANLAETLKGLHHKKG